MAHLHYCAQGTVCGGSELAEDPMRAFTVFALLNALAGALFARQDTLVESGDQIGGFGGDARSRSAALRLTL